MESQKRVSKVGGAVGGAAGVAGGARAASPRVAAVGVAVVVVERRGGGFSARAQLATLVGVARERLDGPLVAQAAADDALEGEAEVVAEERVQTGVDGRVAVTQPEEDREDQRVDALDAERAHHVHREKGQPTQNEPAHDDAQRLGRLRLHPETLHLRTQHLTQSENAEKVYIPEQRNGLELINRETAIRHISSRLGN